MAGAAAGSAAVAAPRCSGSVASLAVSVDLPRARVPLSFIIDDSTCLVNMGRYCMPQFAATYPDRKDYQRPWRDWPVEIPDVFVRQFSDWCQEFGVKGKYSIVPNPACVGWLDRTLPGWSQKQLEESLRLVRDELSPNWDIHPEMITHTRAIDLKTGRPFPSYSPEFMENSFPQGDVSVDYLANYLAYALKILKNCDLPCEGITTPGGFGNRVKEKLPQAVFQAVQDVYGCDLPHYFKYVIDGDGDTQPTVESGDGLPLSATNAVVNVPAGTGDWFGGWDGFSKSQGARYANQDATAGRMVELILRRQPAIMLCHWPGMFCNGTLAGFQDFQSVVTSLSNRFSDETIWMKVSDIARYWAAKEFTQIETGAKTITLQAAFACKDFTLTLDREIVTASLSWPTESSDLASEQLSFSSAPQKSALRAGTFYNTPAGCSLCFDLKAGTNTIQLDG